MDFSFEFTFDITGFLVFGFLLFRFCYFVQEDGFDIAVRKSANPDHK